MKYTFLIMSFLLAQTVKCEIDSYIVGGTLAKYYQFPHSVYIFIKCVDVSSICGGSILNQAIVLTAAHCVEDCSYNYGEVVKVGYGHEDIRKMNSTTMIKHVINEKYNEAGLEYDIGLILTKERISLNDHVKRVILMTSPPTAAYGYVAGWGLTENGRDSTLRYTKVKIQEPNICKLYTDVLEGVFCGGPITGQGWPYSGDSGCGLIVKNTIQIGLVAYKVPNHSLTGYMNISYFLDWIKKSSEKLYCYDDDYLM